MSRYLTNTSLKNKHLCLAAAKASGFDITFEDEPMPRDPSDPDDAHYDRLSLIGTHGAVKTNEPAGKDHSPFWRAWDELENRAS